MHRPRRIHPDEFATVRGIPCTTAARTLLDLGDVLGPEAVAKAVTEAEILRIFDLVATLTSIGRVRGKRGAAVLAGILDRPEAAMTRNELEARFLKLCRRAGLPEPEVNAWLPELGIRPDFLWRRERLMVETDGFETHGTRAAFEADRWRDQRTAAAGWRTFRCTWRQVVRDSGELAKVLRAVYQKEAFSMASSSSSMGFE